MAYYIAKTFSRPFDTVVAQAIECLKAEGFGVLTDIDIQATLKARIGVDIPKYRILGACNPHLAHEGLKLEGRLGVLLPCNVIVRETAEHQVEVAGVDPVNAMERTGNPALAATAEDVRQRLTRAISAIGTVTAGNPRQVASFMKGDIEEAFSRIDENGDRSISFEEFAGLMREMDHAESDSALRVSFAAIDKDRDGRVSFAEFSAWVSR